MTEIKSSVDLTVEAKSIYEAWNWDMLEAQMESGYDRGAFRELVNMYVNLIDNDVSLLTTIESQKETIDEQYHTISTSNIWNSKLKDEIESLKAITELKNAEIVELREREFNHYPIVILELETRIFKLEDEISKLNTAAVLTD